jgi:predicted sulfurtransferase
LIGRLERLAGWARRAGWWDVVDVIGPVLKDLRKTEREREWPLGRCVWCWVNDQRLREAVVRDQGGGPPMCRQHDDDIYPDTTEAS